MVALFWVGLVVGVLVLVVGLVCCVSGFVVLCVLGLICWMVCLFGIAW